MNHIKLHDKTFELFITSEFIQNAISNLATRLNDELSGKDVVFIGVLNGSFMFASDLLKKISFNCRITFLKLASYEGTSSTGKVKSLIGLNEDIRNKTVVIIEDIVDTGETLENILMQLKGYEPEQLKVVTLLFKPEAYKKKIPVDYVGIEIPNNFIVGYGLDYDGLGRNLEDLFVIKK